MPKKLLCCPLFGSKGSKTEEQSAGAGGPNINKSSPSNSQLKDKKEEATEQPRNTSALDKAESDCSSSKTPTLEKEKGTATTASNTMATDSSNLPMQGQVFALTGGASGIGLGTAKMISKRGATVCIADVDPEALKNAEAYFSSQGAAYMVNKVDVSKRKEVDGWIDEIVAKFGKLDGACNAAGIIGKGHGIASVADLDDDEWDRIIAVNLTGTMYCMRAQLRKISDKGSIVNVSSIHGVKGFAKHAAYDASKHGIVGLTKAAALEMGAREVRVNAVAPGAIYTPLMQKNWDERGRPSDAPFEDPSAFQRQGSVEETASVIAFLLGPESTFVSGSVYAIDGAWI